MAESIHNPLDKRLSVERRGELIHELTDKISESINNSLFAESIIDEEHFARIVDRRLYDKRGRKESLFTSIELTRRTR